MKALRPLVFATLLAAAVSPALAVDRHFSTDAPDLDGIRDKIEAADYRGAIADLNALIDDGVQHADVYNLMGFSLRKSGDTGAAMTFYRKALEFDPDHKGALEYSGELYLQLGDVARARENEARLKALCPQGCEELADLQQAIEQATAKSQ
ncbi:tetratricopeptide repeat protein [Inquilinus limosus]|uniref:tetratricopeptide repeat protein n=1 Tax=Inquilinus limosus TaxID=171674 RepID=UPI003F15AC6A